jgi:hypothetical protein
MSDQQPESSPFTPCVRSQLRVASGARLIDMLVRAERSRSGFPNPIALAADVGVSVFSVPLPGGCTELIDDETILVAPAAGRREFGERIFRGLAGVVLEREQGLHTVEEVKTMAARLAAPPRLMRLAGLDETIRCQRWATRGLIRRWWALHVPTLG